MIFSIKEAPAKLIQYQSDSIEALRCIGTSQKYIIEEKYGNDDVRLTKSRLSL